VFVGYQLSRYGEYLFRASQWYVRVNADQIRIEKSRGEK
jgi:hypothetical protein